MRLALFPLLFFIVSITTVNAQSLDEEPKKFRDDRRRFAVGLSTAGENLTNPFFRFPQLVRINSRISFRFMPSRQNNIILSINPFLRTFNGSYPTTNGGSAYLKTSSLDLSLAYLYSMDIASRDWDLLVGGQLETRLDVYNPVGSYDPAVDGDLPFGNSSSIWSFDALVGIRYTVPIFPVEIDLRGGPSLQERLRFFEGGKSRFIRLASPRLGVRYTFGVQL